MCTTRLITHEPPLNALIILIMLVLNTKYNEKIIISNLTKYICRKVKFELNVKVHLIFLTCTHYRLS